MVNKQELLQLYLSLVQMMSYFRNSTLKKSKRSSKAIAKNTMKAKGSEASLAWPEDNIELWKHSNQSSIKISILLWVKVFVLWKLIIKKNQLQKWGSKK